MTGQTNTRVKPEALKDGDRVAIIAPSSRVAKPSTINRCRRIVEDLGFKPELGDHLLSMSGHTAGTDEERLADLNKFLADESIKGIFCISGGSGALHLLNRLDYQWLAQHPKVIVGGDENSSLALAVYVKSGLVSFVGPNLDEISSKECFQRLKSAVKSKTTLPKIVAAPSTSGDLPVDYSFAPVAGRCSGPLVGGTLTALSALMGTPFQPSLKNAVLFLNDRDERTDILERWLTGMWAAGVLHDIQGAALGSFDNCDGKGAYNLLSVEDEFADRFRQLAKPCCFDFPLASKVNALTVPIGIEATLDCGDGALEFKEAALS